LETYRLEHLDCAACARKIEDGVRKTPGVRSVSVDFATLSMRIDADDMKAVIRVVRALEPEVRVKRPNDDDEEPFRLGRELVVLVVGIALLAVGFLTGGSLHAAGLHWVELLIFGAAYLVSGWNVLVSAARGVFRGRVFNEHFLMTVATAGAFAIHAFGEAAGVMIFYKIGEILQDLAVDRSRRSIRKLLELRPDSARVLRGGTTVEVPADSVEVGEEISIRPGERVPLDGIVTLGEGFMDTSALTGEPVPRRVRPESEVLAGWIASDGGLTLRVSRKAGESSAAKIVSLVESASHSKAKTELFITRFARIYTPIVVAAAALVAFLPPLLVSGASLHDWVYRALTMLVISCPCALVVSIPLGYFGGVGGASRRGILVKGARYLDSLAAVRTVVFDKTGTLTKGVFKVTAIEPSDGIGAPELLRIAAMAEAHSNHPIASSIREAYGLPVDGAGSSLARETGGFGVRATVEGRQVLVGSDRLMHAEGIPHCGWKTGKSHAACEWNADAPEERGRRAAGTTVHVAVDGRYAGFISIGDEAREDSARAVRELAGLGVERTALLTGDSRPIAEKLAADLGITECHAGLLPEEKVAHLERIMSAGRGATAFVGDGINDAPVLVRSDVGIAMGGSGADAAVETADVVLMTDSPSRVPEAIRRGKRTRAIVLQNIVMALGVKAAFLALGAAGIAGMWEAVGADMGVALLAILNAARAMR
jgi:Cd2+/Zn2+-exporting ATPase